MSSEHESDNFAEPKLEDGRSWPVWYGRLQYECMIRDIWELVDPAAPDAPHISKSKPAEPPSADSLISQLNQARGLAGGRLTRASSATAESGSSASASSSLSQPATFADIQQELAIRQKAYVLALATWSSNHKEYQYIFAWVTRTVKNTLLEPHINSLVASNTLSIQALIRLLKTRLAPSIEVTKERVREEYRRVLNRARHGKISPQTWLDSWTIAVSRARDYNLTDVEGFLAIKDFLDAVSALQPSWSAQQLLNLHTAQALGQPFLLLDELSKVFANFIQIDFGNDPHGRAFATFPGASSSSSSSRSSRGNLCPCRADKHPWKYSDCGLLELALTGHTDRSLDPEPSKEDLQAIRIRYKDAKKYHQARAETKHWNATAANHGKSIVS